MAIQRSRLFTGGDQGPQDPSSYTVQIDSPADDILKQKDAVLAGWRAKTDKERQYAQERMNALEENYKIEREYHHQAFKFQQEDNKLVKNAILKNLEQEFKNIDARAKSHKIKSDAIQSIIGTAAGFAQNQANKQKAKQKQWATSQAAEFNTNRNVAEEKRLLSLLRGPQKDLNAARVHAETPIKDGGLGWDQAKISDFFGRSAYEHKLLSKALDQEQAINAIASGVEELKGKNIIPIVGKDGEVRMLNWEQLTKQEVAGKNGKEVSALLAIGNRYMKQELLKMYPDNDLVGEKFDLWATKQGFGVEKTRTSKVASNAIRDGFKITYKALRSELLKEDGDPRMAVKQTLAEHMKVKPPNVSAKEWTQEFVKFLRYGVDADEVTQDMVIDFKELTVPHSGMKEKGGTGKKKEVPISSLVNLTELEAALDRKKARDSQKGKDKWSQTEGLIKYGFQQYVEATQANKEGVTNEDHIIQVKRLLENGSTESTGIAKKIIGHYLKGQGSIAGQTETITDEIIADKLLANPSQVDEEYIRSLPGVSSVYKLKKIDELKVKGALVPTSHKEDFDTKRKTLKNTLGDLAKAWDVGQGRFIGDISVANGMLQLGKDFDRRVKLNVANAIAENEKLPVDKRETTEEIWNNALEAAEGSIIDEIEAGKQGKGKYSFGENIGEKMTLPYFKPSTAEQYNGASRFTAVRLGAPREGGLENYLTNPENHVVQSDRLEKIVKGGEEMPRLIYEIAKKWNVEESFVLEKLLEAENARRADRKQTPLKLPEPSEEEKNLKNTAQQVSSAVRYPYDQNCQGIVQLYALSGGNCHPDNLTALGLFSSVAPYLVTGI